MLSIATVTLLLNLTSAKAGMIDIPISRKETNKLPTVLDNPES